MPRRYWVYNPHSGGVKIPPLVQDRIRKRITDYAEKHFKDKFIQLDIRFRAQLCYIDAYVEPDEPIKKQLEFFGETMTQYMQRLRNIPTHLCRLRYFGDDDRWGFAFYTYSNERYELTVFDDGSFRGKPEDAFRLSSVYLQ